ncbi:hypothetical protein QRW90_16550 [Clostridioides difficile]|uniref:hypothetical protein n=1 Tax=Clostridioides difficile TaxID=1496 RepID=UPI001266CA8C|nr:hypothetical protein [Clostridioides difficile]MDL5120592.1 hypothetical protein [Clostridioides difficile]QFS33391.1 hypothetical protein FTB24_19325 [Clostridioides difficile]QIF80160.1 hypothetical protein EUU24_16945 [Clostridioides difficile]
MYENVNVENEKLVDEFFDSKKSKGMIIEVNKENDYILIKDLNTKEIIKAEVGTGLANDIFELDLPILTCYDKATKLTVNP